MKMKKIIKISAAAFIAILSISCSSSSNLEKDITGKYASQDENEYDNLKDTLEIRQTDDGKFDIQTIANWSAAKKDYPDRPNKNKKAGVWNSYGPGEIKVATLQTSDMTLRITDPMTGRVSILLIDTDKKNITRTSKNGAKTIYHRVQ